MKLLVYLLVVFTVSYLVLIIYGLVFRRRESIKDRLDKVKDLFSDPAEESELSQPFRDRIIRPLYRKAIDVIAQATPKQIGQGLERTIAYAGSPGNINVNRLIAIQLMLAIILPSFLYVLANLMESIIRPFVFILCAVLGFMIPIYYIRSKSRARQSKIRNSLPDTLDLLYVSVEAGLGFDMALKRTAEKVPGPLSDELNRALDEMNKGRIREDALRSVVRRTGVDDLSTFISAVIQSEQLGSNIANMLRIQSSSMRQKRRQRAEEQAMKVPIRMLFPLVFFMFPALFIVILGPAVIRIIDVFSEMF